MMESLIFYTRKWCYNAMFGVIFFYSLVCLVLENTSSTCHDFEKFVKYKK